MLPRPPSVDALLDQAKYIRDLEEGRGQMLHTISALETELGKAGREADAAKRELADCQAALAREKAHTLQLEQKLGLVHAYP